MKNADPKKVEEITKMSYPSLPPPLDESDIADVTLDLSQAAIEAEVTQQELDMSGMERVPDADPGLDVGQIFVLVASHFSTVGSNRILKLAVDH